MKNPLIYVNLYEKMLEKRKNVQENKTARLQGHFDFAGGRFIRRSGAGRKERGLLCRWNCADCGQGVQVCARSRETATRAADAASSV